ncbi:MAG: hypothetical protein HXS43_12675, partial [Theionarchaea archaeon]|nr:hypothetical protein [Theionarchaea archaeon]
VFLSLGLVVTSRLILTQGGRIEDPAGGLPLILLVQGVMCWAIGLVILRIGRMRFERVE